MVFLRDEVFREDYKFTVEDKVRLGREVMKRGLKSFLVRLLFALVLVVAMFSSFAGDSRTFGIPTAGWWGICAVGLGGLLVLMRKIGGCPGCGRSLVGRNTYARECVRCGVPLDYFAWRRYKAMAQRAK